MVEGSLGIERPGRVTERQQQNPQQAPLPGSSHHLLLPLIGLPFAVQHRSASRASLPWFQYQPSGNIAGSKKNALIPDFLPSCTSHVRVCGPG
jgi:hypothetical protein